MSNIEDLAADLDAVSVGLARSENATAAAVLAAEQISARAAAAGFAGIAENVMRICDAVRDVRGGIGALSRVSAEARSQAGAAVGERSPQETIGAIASVVVHLGDLQSRAVALVEQVSQSRRLVAAVLAGGQPRPMLSRLDGIRQTLSDVIGRLVAARRHAETALAEAKAVGESGNRERTRSPDDGPPTAPTSTRIRDAARTLPDRPDGMGPTHGVAFDTDTGVPLSTEQYRSGRNVASTKDLQPLPGLKGFPWTLTDHAEARVAQDMRRPGASRDVTLVVNNEPCVDDPYGCDRLLRHIILSSLTEFPRPALM